MAPVCTTRTSGVFLLLFLIINACALSPPWILSVRVNNVSCIVDKCVYNVDVSGSDVQVWSVTYKPAVRGSLCETPISENFGGTENVEFEVDNSDGKLYFCARNSDGVWLHQGEYLYLEAHDVIGHTVFAR